MIKNFILLLSVISIAISVVTNAEEQIRYPAVADNPSYGLVTQLAHKPATAKVAYGDDENQFGLLWTSEKHVNSETLVVLIHGGCWLTAYDIEHTYPMATAVHQAGFNVWSLEYRRTGESGGGWPTTYEDIKAGIKAIGQLTQRGINPKRILIAGHSAGGHLALLAARDKEQLLPADVELTTIGLAAISDLTTYSKGDNGCQKAGVQFMAGPVEEQSEAYQAANPIDYEISGSVILMHGAKDPIVAIDQSMAFVKDNTTVIEIPEAGHFDWVHPGSPAFAAFIKQLQRLRKNN